MRSVISLILVYCLAITSVFAQSVNPNDTLKIGKASSSSDKGLTFDTNDGVSNKKLLIEKISKKLKFDGNTFQIGDGSGSSDKELIIAGALKSLKYNGTSGEFEFNDDVKLSGTLKADFLQAVNTEVAINSLLRASQGIKVGAGANEIRVNAGNLEFSNDGVLYKKFGTGSGGGSTGVNLLENDSFEDGISTGWTNSGGTFSQQTYTNSSEGDTKYARFISSGAGQYIESSAVLITDSMTGGCQADFKKYNTVTSSAFKVQAISGASTVLAEQTLSAGSWVKAPTISFVCPSAGTSVKLRLISLLAGTIEIDKGYFGSNQNLVYSSQAKFFGSIKWSATSICSWNTASTSFANFAIDSDCPTPIVSGSASAPATKIPAIVFTSMPAGDYLFNIRGGLSPNTAGSASQDYYRISDGTNNGDSSSGGRSQEGGSVTVYSLNGFTQRLSYGVTQSNVTINVQAKTSNAANLANFAADLQDAVIEVWYFPSQSEVAVSPEQSSWLIDANIGGSSNPALGNSNISSYTSINDSGLDLVVNGLKGSHSAEIACTPGTSSSGLNCGASNESVGIAFIPPQAGSYEACFAFSHYTQSNSSTGGSRVEAAFQVIQTENNSAAILQEGGEKLVSSPSYTESQADNGIESLSVCGSFTFSDTSKKTIRLMYEQITIGSPLANGILADRSASLGQRDIKITVRPLLSAYNRPVLTGDQMTVPGASKPVTIFANVNGAGANGTCNSSPCTLSNNYGFSSITRTSSGVYVGNFTKSFLVPPTCTVTALGNNANNGLPTPYINNGGSVGTVSQTGNIFGTGSIDLSFSITCVGIIP